MSFPERLTEQMNKHGFKQQALAEKAGVVQQTVSKWKQGKAFPDVATLIALSNLFGVSVDYLLGLSDVEFFDTKKDPSQEELERAKEIAAAALSGDPVNQDMPRDVKQLSALIEQIVDQALDKRSTPSGDQSG